MRQRNKLVVDPDLAEDAGILFLKSRAAAFEVFQDAIEFFAAEIAKWISAANQVESLVRFNRGHGRQSDNVLGDDVVRLLLDLDRIERAFADKLRRDDRFDEIVDVCRDEHAVAAPVE